MTLDKSKVRLWTYWIFGILLALGFLARPGLEWRGSGQLHTLMEAVATLLALIVGVMALVRFYSRKDNTFLFVGAGFIGTAFLDGYHAIVTSSFFAQFLPSDLCSLIPWSWVASRMFLSIALYLSFLAWKRERRLGAAGKIPEKWVYWGSAILTLVSFLFFAFVPLPRAYYPEIFFHRPEEFVPALFFLLALIGYFRQGKWRNHVFEHWMMLTLIVSFLGQAVFMSHSGQLFDFEFDIAHLLKKSSYLFVLTGLTVNMFYLFRQADENAERIRAMVDNIADAIITIDEKGVIQSSNPGTERIFGFSSQELIGKNISELAAEPYRSGHDAYLANFLDTGNAKIIGKPREVEGRKKSGIVFPMDLTVTELRVNNERLFLGIVRDITERKEMDRLKSEFISTVSHELRTPLTSIRGSLGMISSGKLGEIPEKAERMIKLARRNSERLINLVNDLLDVEKIQSGKLEFHFERLDLTQLVKKSIESTRPFADEHGVTFEMGGSIPAAYITGDNDRLMQVMTNLLSNAAKFSSPGDKVEISVTREGNMIRVSVADQGLGIPEDFQDRIFERFTQADSSDTRIKGGTGLGLNISKAIVDVHKGIIDFHTTHGQGSTFYFELREAAEMEMEAGKGPPTQPGLSPGELEEGRNVLILEDNADVAHLIAMMLEQNGFNTEIAHSAGQAKKLLSEKMFHALTVDILLPDQDGIAFIRELRIQERFKDLAIVVVSVQAKQTHQEVVTAAMGVVDWLEKPIDQDRLLHALQKAARPEGAEKPRVLYVEDDLDLAEVINSMAGDAMELIIAPTLTEAREILANQRFDLVILDVALPDGSGLDLLPLLKNSGGAITPVIIFSANGVNGEISRKVDAALEKSRTSNEELLETIKSLLPAQAEKSLLDE